MILRILRRFIFGFLLILSAAICWADNNFNFLSEGKYFTVYTKGAISKERIVQKINSTPILFEDSSTSDLLSKSLDSLFLEVSDILDIHIYSFHGTIKILPNTQEIATLAKANFGNNYQGESFYIPSNNTIYISATDLTLGMIGHEIAHAIISSYFVVPPPAKVQEVLCGYVEYTLRKKTNSLP